MSIQMIQVEQGTDINTLLQSKGIPWKHEADGYPLVKQDSQQQNMYFVIPPAACPIDAPWATVVSYAENYYDAAITQNEAIRLTKPYEFIQAVIAAIVGDASSFIDNQDWNTEIKSYIRDNLLRPGVIAFLEGKGDIVLVT